MFAQKKRFALTFQRAKHVGKPARCREVEVRRRLVQKKNVRVHGPGTQKRDQLPFAAGKRVDAAVFQMFQMKDAEGFAHTFADLRLRQSVIFQTERDFGGTVDGEKLTARVLKDGCGKFADLSDAQIRRVFSVQTAKALQFALIKLRDQAIDAAKKRGFAAAAAAAEYDAASVRDLSRDVLQRLLRLPGILKVQLEI